MSSPPLATNVDQAYRVCNPEKPLAADDERYVNLAEVCGMKNFADTISRNIVLTPAEDGFHKQLVTGHRGCGKSTEILRLQAVLEAKKFFVIYVDVEDMLDLGEVDYLDVLLAMAQEIEAHVRQRCTGMDEQLLKNIYDWFADKVLTDEKNTDMKIKLESKAKLGGKIPFVGELFSDLTSDIQSGSSQRVTIRQNLERQQADFLKRLNELIHEARKQVQAQDL